MVHALLPFAGDREGFAGGPNGRAGQEGTAMGRYNGKAHSGAFQTMVVKLALSFGMVLWMFLAATLSHV